jgi:hypothetical protein
MAARLDQICTRIVLLASRIARLTAAERRPAAPNAGKAKSAASKAHVSGARNARALRAVAPCGFRQWALRIPAPRAP